MMIYDPPTPVERVMARKRWIRFVVVLVVVLAAHYYLIKVGKDPKLTADNLIDAINSEEVGGNLNFVERLIYRYAVFPRVQQALLLLSQQLSFVNRQHNWGPGRVDTFNPYKAIQFHFPMEANNVSETELNAAADFP